MPYLPVHLLQATHENTPQHNLFAPNPLLSLPTQSASTSSPQPSTNSHQTQRFSLGKQLLLGAAILAAALLTYLFVLNPQTEDNTSSQHSTSLKELDESSKPVITTPQLDQIPDRGQTVAGSTVRGSRTQIVHVVSQSVDKPSLNPTSERIQPTVDSSAVANLPEPLNPNAKPEVSDQGKKHGVRDEDKKHRINKPIKETQPPPRPPIKFAVTKATRGVRDIFSFNLYTGASSTSRVVAKVFNGTLLEVKPKGLKQKRGWYYAKITSGFHKGKTGYIQNKWLQKYTHSQPPKRLYEVYNTYLDKKGEYYLSLRSSPTPDRTRRWAKSMELIGKLKDHTRVEVLRRNVGIRKRWLKVRVYDGPFKNQVGYVHSRWIKRI